MSDCKHGGRDSYAVPKPVEQATIKRMCREFGKPPWTYPVDKPECWPDEAVELVGAIEFGGVRYERVRECEFEWTGRYCPPGDLVPQDMVQTCSACGGLGNDPSRPFHPDDPNEPIRAIGGV